MTNAPETRKTHVIRILGTNRDGEVLQDIWVDVERIDETASVSHGDAATDASYQKVKRKFRWMDDPNADDYNPEGNPSRETEIVKVCDPESEDVDDPEEYVEIPVIKKVRMVASDNNYQKVAEKLINDELQASREVEVRKIPHYDTSIDDAAQAAFDADPTLKVYVVPGGEYTKDLDTKDEDQYVEHEIVTKIRQRSNSSKRPSGGSDQLRRIKIKNQYLIDESEEPDGKVVGVQGVNPPYRLDPYQNIVNVNWSSPEEIMVGLEDPQSSLTSKDGSEWIDEFGGTTSTAATGLGRTVVTSGLEFVCFGKPRDGDRCFIKVDQSGTIERGVIVDGSLSWTVVGSIPIVEDDGDVVLSCVFAGEGFFISYVKFQTDQSLLAVSFSGESFVTGINPWLGVAAAANGSGEEGQTANPTGGCVAYDPDTNTYVTVGNYFRGYAIEWDNFGEPFITHFFDENFMSSRSSNGSSWTPSFDTSEGTGIGGAGAGNGSIAGPNVSVSSSVAFGNGVFVAAVGKKHTKHYGGHPDTYLYRWGAAAAVSSDGSTWSVVDLPGQTVTIDHISVGSAVKFVKKKNGDLDGYFVMASVAGSDDPGGSPTNNSLWVSTDGFGWSQVHSDSEQYGWVMSIIKKNRGEVVFV